MPRLAPVILLQVTRADVGRTAFAVHARPIHRKDPSLSWFGLSAFLYGLRLLARTDTFPLLFGAGPAFWLYLASAITYVVPIPGALFLRATFPAWRRPLGWMAGFLGAFAACALSSSIRWRPATASCCTRTAWSTPPTPPGTSSA